ncbi:uncharacterized protein B0J16DRAFT_386850 [Fusarium flagelliforme]|uniref:uncharacterized protein n=1 Tax=Fusarium flagelliforme TaxID=2675880 RepID=UPI001E8E464C|nr:uncharacterized protein B0J16DRAFT_386850 [Fusarium flagelliforme]KAH7179029.1 hypothetical protein B0J16DRAFT_386850 [Fusarium flagelliforme]
MAKNLLLTPIYAMFGNTTNAGTGPQQDRPSPEDGKPDTKTFNTAEQQPQQYVDNALAAQLKQLESELEEKGRKVQELQQECVDLKNKLDEKSTTEAKVRRNWKKIAKELDKLRANSQGFYQITDAYLVDQINHLKISIRDFSIQYFDGKSVPKGGMTETRPDYWIHLENSASDRDLNRYLKSPKDCHKLVQAFLWRVLIKQLFFKFEWLGKDYCDEFYGVWRRLRPLRMVDHERRTFLDDPEAERKFHSWRATTIAMFLDRLEPRKVDFDLKGRTDEYVRRIFNTLRGLVKRDEEKGCKDQIAAIINQAFSLDKEINRQAAHVRWISNIQQVKTGNYVQRVKQDGVVLSPEVLKRGKSTGESFDQEMTLVKMEIGYIE